MNRCNCPRMVMQVWYHQLRRPPAKDATVAARVQRDEKNLLEDKHHLPSPSHSEQYTIRTYVVKILFKLPTKLNQLPLPTTMYLPKLSTAAILALCLPFIYPGFAEAKENWRVKAYTDRFCNDVTGSYSHNTAKRYESFSGLPDIMSIEADGPLGEHCGFHIRAWSDDDGGSWWTLDDRHCLRVNPLGPGDLRTPLKGFQVWENPC